MPTSEFELSKKLIAQYEAFKQEDQNGLVLEAILQYAKEDKYFKVTGDVIELSKYALSRKDKGVK